jgi:hypothetical protein
MVTKRLIKGIVKGLLKEMAGADKEKAKKNASEAKKNASEAISEYFEREFPRQREVPREFSKRDDARATVAASIELLMGNGELRLENDIFNVIKGILLGNGLLDGSSESREALINIMNPYMMDDWKDRDMHELKKAELLSGE